MNAPAKTFTTFQITSLVALRMLVGWHFFYEGLAKRLNPYWTSAEYLDGAQWLLKGMFRSVAASATAVTIVDFLNVWGLMAIGLGLLTGLFTRAATIAGVVLLGLYYLAAPPFAGLTYAMPTEGTYLVVNKVLIEAVALLVLLAYPTGHLLGLDRLVAARGGLLRRTRAQANA
jgi:thiosulfate dehydrogenase [quinone] large subunit